MKKILSFITTKKGFGSLVGTVSFLSGMAAGFSIGFFIIFYTLGGIFLLVKERPAGFGVLFGFTAGAIFTNLLILLGF